MHPLLRTLFARFQEPGAFISDAEALAFLALPAAETPHMLALGAMVRGLHQSGTLVCGIINAKSGACPEDCAFCAQSARHKTASPHYPLVDADTLLNRAEALAAQGARHFGIVTSGTSPSPRELDALCEAALRIRQRVDIGLCASLGIIDRARAEKLRQAGFSRYHHNLETAASYFPSICSTHPYEQDVQSVHAARAAGLSVCTGGIFGLGESLAQRVEFARTLADLAVDSLPVNFLNPIAGTRLAGQPPLSVPEALRILAMLRLMLPAAHILVCGGRASTLGDWQSWIFAAGASGVMIGNYLTTAGSEAEADQRMLDTLGSVRE